MVDNKLFGAFPQIDATGDYARLEEVDVILASILTILATLRGSRFWEPSFGCDLMKYIFEPQTNAVVTAIHNDVEAALKTWENRVKYDRIEVQLLDTEAAKTRPYNTVLINIEFTYKGKRYRTKLIMPDMIDLLSGPIFKLRELLV